MNHDPQAITGWECDEHGDWVALLACGHRQHVRHTPPFQERPWVLTAGGREAWVGRPLECRLCGQEADDAAREGGEAPCLAESVCSECGAVVGAGGGAGHRPGCRLDGAVVREDEPPGARSGPKG